MNGMDKNPDRLYFNFFKETYYGIMALLNSTNENDKDDGIFLFTAMGRYFFEDIEPDLADKNIHVKNDWLNAKQKLDYNLRVMFEKSAAGKMSQAGIGGEARKREIGRIVEEKMKERTQGENLCP